MTARASMVVLLAFAALAAVGCKNNLSTTQPSTFERAGDVAFACFDLTARQPVPFNSQACDIANNPQTYMPVALVTQTSTGEVASVDLNESNDPNAGKVFDLYPQIPGYTFYEVMPSPVAIVAPKMNPRYAYVASFSGRAVQAIPLEDLLPPRLQPQGDAGVQPPPPQSPVLLGGSPTDMVLGPSEQALYVAVPRLTACAAAGGMDAGTPDGGATSACGGQVYRIPLNNGVMGAPQPLLHTDPNDPLPVTLPNSVPATLPLSAQPDAYQLTCAPQGVTPPLSVPTPPIQLHSLSGYEASAARPVALAVDDTSSDPHILVADEGLPIIHRIDLNSLDESPAFAVGVPTRRLAVTPTVPSTLASTSPTARYVYAIDDTDQSILVVDDTPGASTLGAVLPVSPGSSTPYRLPFSDAAAALAVAQPELNGASCDSTNSGSYTAGPLQLNGVFLAAALTDGTLRVVDVQDNDVTCRGYDPTKGTCTTPGTGNVSSEDQQVYIRRNRPRIGQYITQSDESVTLSAAPLFRIDSAPASVLGNGATASGEPPGLTPFYFDMNKDMPCPEGMAQVYPAPGTANPLVCALADPWMAQSQNWYAIWQGQIPGTTGFGVLDDTNDTLEVGGVAGGGAADGGVADGGVAGDGRLCDEGVLGKDNVASAPAGDPLLKYHGDALVITSSLLRTKQNETKCQNIAGDSSSPNVIAFPILHANQTYVTLQAKTVTGTDMTDIVDCYGDHVSFAVQTQGVYTVYGSSSGFLNPVAARSNGDCYVPANADPGDRGRAFQGQLFSNRQVAFEIPFYSTTQGNAGPQGDTTVQLSFGVTGAPLPMSVGLTQTSSTALLPVVPSAVRYNPVNKYLYVVDSANQGLIEFKLQPLQLNRSFE